MTWTILLVEDEENARVHLTNILEQSGYSVIPARDLTQAQKVLAEQAADMVLLDWMLPDGNGSSVLHAIARLPEKPPVIVITGYRDIDTAVEAMRNGALDFLTKPIKVDRLLSALRKAEDIVEMRRELALLRRSQAQQIPFVVGNTPAMHRLLDDARRAAQVGVSVLITGETGTGKEVLARFIHQHSPRAEKPFVPINCAAIPEDLLESELFGHEPGAFTDAKARKTGLIEAADGGVLFLDEIASMPLAMQAKLLRVLEERTVRRVGGTRWMPVDVQVIAASNRDLKQMIAEGTFREDLYYRLRVVELRIPPLRERRDDIPQLVGHFLREASLRMNRPVEGTTERALSALQAYHWPGNIRELKHVIERAVLFCDDPLIDLNHLPPEVILAYEQHRTQV